MRQVAESTLLEGYSPAVLWVALGFFGLFLLIAVPALWGDLWRRRKRPGPRCPKCWYSMAGVDGLRCPECGRLASSPGQLMRSRRRWGWVAIALVALTAGAAGVYARVRGIDGVVAAFVPDRVIVAQAHKCRWYHPTTPWEKFCVRVLGQRYGWDWPASVRRQALALEGVSIVPAKLEARPAWPSGSLVRVLVGGKTAGSTLLSLSGTRVLAEFDAATIRVLPPGVLDRMDVTQPILMDLGVLPDGSYTLGVTLTLVDRNDQPLIASPASLTFVVGGDVGVALSVRTEPAVQAWLSEALRGCVTLDQGLGVVDVTPVDGADHEPPPPLAVRIERDGVVVARGSAPLAVPFYHSRAYRVSGETSVPLAGALAALASADLKSGAWTVVLEPDVEAMLAEPGRTSYPALSIRLPLTGPRQAPDRRRGR